MPLQVKTVKVSNVSLSASRQDIKEFFSFSGEIVYVELRRESEKSQVAYVTFKDSQGADTAVLLTGATIVERTVDVIVDENYQLPVLTDKFAELHEKSSHRSRGTGADEFVSSLLAKSFMLGKNTLDRLKSIDERHGLTANASATVASIDRSMGLSEKINMGTSVVSEKVKEMDEKFQVSQTTRSAFSAAEQKASTAGSAILSNSVVVSGKGWLTVTLNRVAKAAEDVGSMTKEKVKKAEEERRETISKERTGMVSEFAQLHLDDDREPATVPVEHSAPVIPVEHSAPVIPLDDKNV